jgi:hypothetical protein
MKLFWALLVLMACSYDLSEQDAIEAANLYLTAKDCGKALEVLEGYSDPSPVYFQIKASAIACTAGYSEIDILDNEIGRFNTVRGHLNALTQIYGTDQSTGITDPQFEKLKLAFDTLTYMGLNSELVDPATIGATSWSLLEMLGYDPYHMDIDNVIDVNNDPLAASVDIGEMRFIEPSTANRLAKMATADSADTNLQAIGMLVVNFARYLNYYGNVGEDGSNNGERLKGKGNFTNECFATYSTATWDAFTHLAVNGYSCNGPGDSGHTDIATIPGGIDPLIPCHGITMLNQLIDISTHWNDEYFYRVDILQDIETKLSGVKNDIISQLGGPVGPMVDALSSSLNVNNCLKTALLDPEMLELYFALIFETLVK